MNATEVVKKNMKDKFVASNFDEVDIVLDTDRRFDEAIAAADNGETDLVDAIVKEMKDWGIGDDSIEEDNIVQYNPEDIDACGILDDTASAYTEYVSEEDYGDDDGEMIDSIMNDNMEYEDDSFYEV